MKKLLIIDKDQTLVRSRLGGDNFVQKPWDQVSIPNMAYKLNKLHQDGWKIVIASNQGGIKSGYKTLESAFLEFEYCLELFMAIDEAFFCPDYEGEYCWRMWRNKEMKDNIIPYDRTHFDSLDFAGKFRKPNPGMLQLAIHLHTPDKCLYVGDRPEDESAAEAAGIPYKHRNEFLEIDLEELQSVSG